MAVYTDIAAELYPESRGSVPRGVKTFTATASGIGLTRVEIERSGLRRPKGRYITLDMPQFAAIDDRNEAYVWAIASQLRALLPKEGLVLVAGVGNRAVTADALGPETADRVFVTRHLCEHPDAGDDVALRPVAAFSPGVEGNTGLATAELLQSVVRRLEPAAVVCVDSLCTSDVRRLGCSVQLSTAGLSPHTAVMEVDNGARALVVTPKDIDAIIRRGATLLALAINKALQPALSVGELTFLTS